MSTSPNATAAPGSPSSFSTTSRSPGWTRYCLPPVLITAYIVRAFGTLSVSQKNGNAPAGGPAGERWAVIQAGGGESTAGVGRLNLTICSLAEAARSSVAGVVLGKPIYTCP